MTLFSLFKLAAFIRWILLFQLRCCFLFYFWFNGLAFIFNWNKTNWQSDRHLHIARKSLKKLHSVCCRFQRNCTSKCLLFLWPSLFQIIANLVTNFIVECVWFVSLCTAHTSYGVQHLRHTPTHTHSFSAAKLVFVGCVEPTTTQNLLETNRKQFFPTKNPNYFT